MDTPPQPPEHGSVRRVNIWSEEQFLALAPDAGIVWDDFRTTADEFEGFPMGFGSVEDRTFLSGNIDETLAWLSGNGMEDTRMHELLEEVAAAIRENAFDDSFHLPDMSCPPYKE